MATYQAVITFGASAIQLTDPTNGVTTFPASGAFCRRILIEPLRTNTAIMSVGLSNVTSDGSGTGVISELGAVGTAATTVLDRYDDRGSGGNLNIDPSQFWVKGTSTQKCKVTLFTM